MCQNLKQDASSFSIFISFYALNNTGGICIHVKGEILILIAYLLGSFTKELLCGVTRTVIPQKEEFFSPFCTLFVVPGIIWLAWKKRYILILNILSIV